MAARTHDAPSYLAFRAALTALALDFVDSRDAAGAYAAAVARLELLSLFSRRRR